MIFLCKTSSAQDSFPDPAQPVQIPHLGLSWVKTQLIMSQFRREIEMQQTSVLSEKTSATNLNVDIMYRFKKRLVFRFLVDQQFSEKTSRTPTDTGTQLGFKSTSSSRSGFKDPSMGAIYPFVGLKGKWLVQGLYSPSMGSGGPTSSKRGGSNINLKITGQWKHEKMRPFGEFTFDMFGGQNLGESTRGSYNQMTLKLGVYGYFDRQFSSSLTMAFVNVGAYAETSSTETVAYPQFGWRSVNFAAYYKMSEQTSYFFSYVFSVFPDLDFGTFKVTGNSGSAVQAGIVFYP